jgi:hypothetical protein
MNEPNRNPPTAAGRACVRYLAMLGAVALVGVSLVASRASVLPTPEPAIPAAQQAAEKSPADRAATAANGFLDTLDAKQRAIALLDFNSPKKHTGWSNLPVTFVPRSGVRLGDLNKDQHKAAMETMAAVLSKEGYQKIVDIMDADQQLAERQGGKKGGKGGKGGKKGGKGGEGPMFGRDQYYIAIYGKPSATAPWMVQFGGHHLGVNVTMIGKNFVLTPTHTGTEPSAFMRGGKEIRPLGLENDTAFMLINDLDEKQRAQAIIGTATIDLRLGPGRDGETIKKPQGIKGSALTPQQQATLLKLIGTWVDMLKGDSASARMAQIKSKIGDTYFAWSGPTAKGSVAYFRVQGPTLVIEYAPQKGTTNHIHTIIRNPEDDYGTALLRR